MTGCFSFHIYLPENGKIYYINKKKPTSIFDFYITLKSSVIPVLKYTWVFFMLFALLTLSQTSPGFYVSAVEVF